LNCTGLESEGFYVDAGKVNGDQCYIWTRKFQSKGSASTSRDAPLGRVDMLAYQREFNDFIEGQAFSRRRIIWLLPLPPPPPVRQ
jgi:hypothetical protein